MLIKLTRDKRAEMARSLKESIAYAGHSIQHTTAVKAIATMLGFNEHSLSAAVKAGVELDVESIPSVILRLAKIAAEERSSIALDRLAEELEKAGL